MEKITINETPVRTSRNFQINNIKIESNIIPKKIEPFNNLSIIGENSNIKIEKEFNSYDLVYGLGNLLFNQIKEKTNQKFKITIDNKENQEIRIYF